MTKNIETNMQPTSIDIEQIIRVVMQRLAVAGDLMSGVGEIADTQELDSELVLQDKLVTLGTLDGKLSGKRRLRVQPRAIVTPAVVDELKRFKVELVRDSVPTKHRLVPDAAANSIAEMKSTARVAPILVCGSAVWFESLSRHLCPKQAFVRSCDDKSAIEVMQKHKTRGGLRVIWVSPTPFAANIASASATYSTVILPGLADLKAALEQADPECLIVDASRFTVAAVGNLVRAMFKHLRK